MPASCHLFSFVTGETGEGNQCAASLWVYGYRSHGHGGVLGWWLHLEAPTAFCLVPILSLCSNFLFVLGGGRCFGYPRTVPLDSNLFSQKTKFSRHVLDTYLHINSYNGQFTVLPEPRHFLQFRNVVSRIRSMFKLNTPHCRQCIRRLQSVYKAPKDYLSKWPGRQEVCERSARASRLRVYGASFGEAWLEFSQFYIRDPFLDIFNYLIQLCAWPASTPPLANAPKF